MIETFTLAPGVTLRCCKDHRFKQGRISVQLVRPMCREEASLNALLPMVLLRGTRNHPDLRSITMRLDDLYGATVGDLVRRIGDYQTTGLYAAFTEDRFALPGDKVLEPVADFLWEVLLEPLLGENGVFVHEIVESEKKNLAADLDAQRNDKAAYAQSQLLKTMCSADSFSIPRLGEKEQLSQITARSLHDHYRRILRESPVEVFYVGSGEPAQVAALMKPVFAGVDRSYVNLAAQSPFADGGECHTRQRQDISQSRLCLGFVTDITNRMPEFAAMQMFNTVFGSGMTSKLFMNVREKLSLCYSIGSGYYGSKGIVTVSAGIDADKEDTVRREVLAQLDACRRGQISEAELTAAREAVLSGLRGVMDSPGAIEGFFSTSALGGMIFGLEDYRDAIEKVTLADVVAAANSLRLHSSFFLEGVSG